MSALVFVLVVVVAVPPVAWWLHRDLRRATAVYVTITIDTSGFDAAIRRAVAAAEAFRESLR